jgi:hypothetical protein
VRNYVVLRPSRRDLAPSAAVTYYFFDDAQPYQAATAIGLVGLAGSAAVFRRPPFDTWLGVPEVGESTDDGE